jgi:positive regulator of sigma E activity
VGRVSGTVVEIRDGCAWIACSPAESSCSACASGRGCAWTRGSAERRLGMPVMLDGRPLVLGETVSLEAEERQLLAAAVRLYVPPLAGLLLAPAMLRWLGFEGGVAPLVAAVTGLLLGGLLAHAWTRNAPAVTLRRA